jgi:uncharacterized damage-inducible protein DinB
MRSNRFALMTVVLLAAGSLAAAQSMPAKSPARPIVDGLSALFTGIERPVMATAESAPESVYAYKATPEVRSFGQILAHIADAQLALCDGMQGGNVNLKDTFEKTATTKPAILSALRETFAGCKTVIAGLSDQDAARLVPFGQTPSSIATLLAFTISHGNEHYGNLVTYMRLNGIVPPSSRAR